MQAVAERHQPDPGDEAEPEDAELDADTDPSISERFGAALALDALAGGDVTKYPAVLAMDADTCLLALRLRGAQGAYQRRLHKLLNDKAE